MSNETNEPDTDYSPLVSRILGIPMIIKTNSETTLLKDTLFFSWLPSTFNSKPFSGLMNGTIFGKLGGK
jgi:hypothetical protein